MAIRTPIWRRRNSTPIARSGSAMSALSVISMRSRLAGVHQRARKLTNLVRQWVVEVLRGQVNCHGDIEAYLAPLVLLAQRLAEHPGPEWPDQSCLLGQGDELRWGDNATVWMLPADQGLNTNQLSAREIHLRLVVHD